MSYSYSVPAGSSPHIADVFKLYCSLEAGLTVRDLCMRKELAAMGVNERYGNNHNSSAEK